MNKHKITRNVSHFKRFDGNIYHKDQNDECDINEPIETHQREQVQLEEEQRKEMVEARRERLSRQRKVPERYGTAIPSNIIG